MRYLSLTLVLCTLVIPLHQTKLDAQTFPGNDDGALYFPPKLIFPSERDRPRLIQSESRYHSSIPLLPVIFFDHPAEWTLPPRYQIFTSPASTQDYTDSNAVSGLEYGGYFGKYREILNIIGFRMRKYPHTSIQLKGNYSNDPGESEEIAQTRADIIREYLINVWEIDPERIGTQPPSMGCDSTANSLRREEARRVMINTSNWELIRPVTYPVEYRTLGSVYMQFVVDPQLPPDQVKNVVVIIKGDNEVLNEAVIPGNPDSALYRLRGGWTPNQSETNNATRFTHLTIQAVVQASDGTIRASNEESIMIESNSYESRESERYVKPYAIPFFACGDSTLTGYHKVLVAHILEQQNTTEPVVAELIGTGEYSEDPEIDEGTILEFRQRQNEVSFQEDFQDNSDTYGTLTIFTPRRIEADFELGTPNTTELLIDGTSSPPSQSNPDTTVAEQAFTLDSLAIARSRVLENYLKEEYRDQVIFMDRVMKRQRNTSINQLHLWPELRWYSRSVNMVLYPYRAISEYLEQSKEESAGLPKR